MIRNASYLSILFLCSLLAGCQVIGGIFKAGVWAGVLLVVVIIAIVVFVIRAMSKRP
jgi:hypothetical protein